MLLALLLRSFMMGMRQESNFDTSGAGSLPSSNETSAGGQESLGPTLKDWLETPSPVKQQLWGMQ